MVAAFIGVVYSAIRIPIFFGGHVCLGWGWVGDVTQKKCEKFKEPGKAHVVHLRGRLSLILKLSLNYNDKSNS